MKSPLRLFLALVTCLGTAQAITPNEWKFKQSVDVPTAGLVRLNIPPETLEAARPGLEDLRLLDATGAEVPFLIERPAPVAASTFQPKQFQTSLAPGATVLTIETGSTLSLREIRLEPAGGGEFLKAVKVEGSHDGKKWSSLADGQPIFRTRTGEASLRIAISPGAWEFLRCMIDDSRTAAIPFTGAQLETAGVESPTEPLAVKIRSRDEGSGVTRLALDLGASNLTPAFLRLETPEKLFTRSVSVAVPTVDGNDIKEKAIASTVIYRVELNGRGESHLDIPIDAAVPSRELLLLVANGDSPPLALDQIQAQRRLVQLTFLAKQAGSYQLLSGNRQCAAPNYDLSSLSAELKGASGTALRPSPLTPMPEYKAADNLGMLASKGAPIDTSGWKFHKKLDPFGAGARQVEFDLDVLAGAARDFRDVRIVRDGKQVPFVLERTSISRSVTIVPKPEPEPDKERPTVSRWSLKLPRAGLPVTRVVATAAPGLFQRDMRLFEAVTSEHGDSYPRQLASGRWQQLPDQPTHDYVLQVNEAPTADTLTLETDNGDNPPIELRGFAAYYPVTRAVFVATGDSTEPLWLYYGNPEASAPRYDVSLMANQLLGAERQTVAAGAEEKGTTSAVVTTLSGARRYIFWGTLAVAVATLLIVISRLLPKTEA